MLDALPHELLVGLEIPALARAEGGAKLEQHVAAMVEAARYLLDR